MKVCLNGRFLSDRKAWISPFDPGFLCGEGVYETLLTEGDEIFDLEEHLKRLAKSAKIVNLKFFWSISQIGAFAKEVLRLNKLKTSKLRITLTGGPTLFIYSEKLVVKPGIYDQGVAVISKTLERILPEAKTTSLIHIVEAYQNVDLKKIFEVIMVGGDGFVREGVVTNVFMVKKSVVWTPKNKILAGVVRGKILKMAKKLGLGVAVKDFKLDELMGAEEIFLTNSLKGVVPVVKVNGKKIGLGKPEVWTKKFLENWR